MNWKENTKDHVLSVRVDDKDFESFNRLRGKTTVNDYLHHLIREAIKER